MATENSQLDFVHERAIRLFTYLKELSELRTKTIRTIESYETVIWLADLPREPVCYSASWFDPDGDEHADVWVEVAKPAAPIGPPTFNAELEPWVNLDQVSDSSLEFPELRDRIELPVDAAEEPHSDNPDESQERKVLVLADHQEIQYLWEQYVEEAWWPWADLDRRRRAVQGIYSDLFSIYQRQQRLGEQV